MGSVAASIRGVQEQTAGRCSRITCSYFQLSQHAEYIITNFTSSHYKTWGQTCAYSADRDFIYFFNLSSKIKWKFQQLKVGVQMADEEKIDLTRNRNGTFEPSYFPRDEIIFFFFPRRPVYLTHSESFMLGSNSHSFHITHSCTERGWANLETITCQELHANRGITLSSTQVAQRGYKSQQLKSTHKWCVRTDSASQLHSSGILSRSTGNGGCEKNMQPRGTF